MATWKQIVYDAAVVQGLTSVQVRDSSPAQIATLAGLSDPFPADYSYGPIRKAVSQRLATEKQQDDELADAVQLQAKLREMVRFADAIVKPVRTIVTGPNPGDVTTFEPQEGDWIIRFS